MRLIPFAALAAIAAFVTFVGPANAQLRDVPAGTIIVNSFDANGICPNVCSGADGARWTGNFSTRGRTCECNYGGGRRDHSGGRSYNGGTGSGGRHPGYGPPRRPDVRSVDAGPIFSNMQAQGICPGVCMSQGRTWNGNWRTTQPGRMSVCDCASR